jgi:hypothetical protein
MKTTLTALTEAVLLVVPATGSAAISAAISTAISTTASSGGEAEAFARERDIPVAEAERRLGWQSLAADQ